MSSMIVIADLGRVRFVKIRAAGDDPIDEVHLMEDGSATVEARRPTRGAVVTDQSGRFGRGASAGTGGGMSYGEQHNLESELESKTLAGIAAKIGEELAREGHPAWILAAPQPILRRLERALPPACRHGLVETIGADLTKEPLAKLEQRFLSRS